MATNGVLELLGSWASPYTNRAQMALNLKSLQYELVEENFYSNKSDRLLRANPVHKTIPVLIHGGKPVCESLIILQYIDDTWTGSGPSILPSDPFDRALARFWAAYLDDKWFPSLKELEWATENEATMAKVFEGVALLEDAFTKCSKGKGFFGGDNVGYLDIALGSYLGWIHVIELVIGAKVFDESRCPRLVGWADRFSSHAAVKDVVPQADKLLDFYMMVKAAKAAAAGAAASG